MNKEKDIKTLPEVTLGVKEYTILSKDELQTIFNTFEDEEQDRILVSASDSWTRSESNVKAGKITVLTQAGYTRFEDPTKDGISVRPVMKVEDFSKYGLGIGGIFACGHVPGKEDVPILWTVIDTQTALSDLDYVKTAFRTPEKPEKASLTDINLSEYGVPAERTPEQEKELVNYEHSDVKKHMDKFAEYMEQFRPQERITPDQPEKHLSYYDRLKLIQEQLDRPITSSPGKGHTGPEL